MTGVEKRILLVSRDSLLSLEIDKLLGFNAGIEYELDTIYPFEKALDSINKTEYSLVIIDLPEGNKCIEAVENICSLAAGLPLIVLTHSGFRNAALALKKGADYVVSKSTMDGELFSQNILSAIDRKKIENELKLKDNILQAVNYAAEIFLAQSNWESWIVEVLARLGQASQSDRVYVFRNNKNTTNDFSSVLHAEWAIPGIQNISEYSNIFDSEKMNSGINRWGKLFNDGQIIQGNIKDLPQTEQQFLTKTGVKSLIAVPIHIDHKWWGFIGFDNCKQEKEWTVDEIDALKTAARIFGAAISRQAAEEELTYLATHDFLTGLPNRMLFEDRFNQSVARADRSGEKIAIVSIDMNKFKSVNDSYGHPVGDKVLVEAARRFGSALRSSDTCARIGGDEFGVITENVRNKGDAMRVMEKLTAAMRDPVFEGNKEIWISASMGAAIYPDNGKILEDLMRLADKALYQVKEKQTSFKIYKDEQYTLLKE
jgi:diguanylate cyclase (GGDEF)-like protein